MRNDANSLGSTIDLQWSETFNRKVVKKSFEMFVIIASPMIDLTVCAGKFSRRVFWLGGKHVSLSAICCANISHYVLKVFTSLTTREFALQMFELSAIGTAISISDGYIDYYFRVCERSSWRGRKYHHWRRFICLFNRNVSSPWNRL